MLKTRMAYLCVNTLSRLSTVTDESRSESHTFHTIRILKYRVNSWFLTADTQNRRNPPSELERFVCLRCQFERWITEFRSSTTYPSVIESLDMEIDVKDGGVVRVASVTVAMVRLTAWSWRDLKLCKIDGDPMLCMYAARTIL